MTSVNSYQLKRNVAVHSGTADPSSAVLWVIVPFVILSVCGLVTDEQGLRYSKGVQKCRGVKNITYHITSINVMHGTVQHVVLL